MIVFKNSDIKQKLTLYFYISSRELATRLNTFNNHLKKNKKYIFEHTYIYKKTKYFQWNNLISL